jgi:hypothetical protein
MNGSSLVCAYPILRIVFGSTQSVLMATVRVCVICCVLPFLVLIAAALENSLVLDRGTGVLQHPGFFSFVITAPLILCLTWALLHRTSALVEHLARFSTTGALPAPLRRIVRRKIVLLALRDRFRYFLVLGSIAGLFYTIVNLRWVMDPERFYGTMTFDSPDHLLVFVVNRLHVAFMLVVVIPTGLFVCISVTSFMHRVLKFMSGENLLEIDLFHSDNCGGLSEFGTLNAQVMGIYVCITANIIMNMESHRSHIRMHILPLLVMTALIIFQSIAAVYYIHRCVHAKRLEALNVVNDRLNQQFREMRRMGGFTDDLLTVRNHLMRIRTFPYAFHILSLVNLLRAAPALLAAARLVIR